MIDLTDAEKAQFVIEEYKTVITTQIHFNDMMMRMRTIVFSVVIAVFGGSGALLGQYPTQFFSINNCHLHVAAPVVFCGLMLLLAIFVMDFFYYYKMLIGAVERGYEFDEFFKKYNTYPGFHSFGMSEKIRDKIGKTGLSKWLLITFYSVIGFAGIVFLIFIVFFIRDPL